MDHWYFIFYSELYASSTINYISTPSDYTEVVPYTNYLRVIPDITLHQRDISTIRLSWEEAKD